MLEILEGVDRIAARAHATTFMRGRHVPVRVPPRHAPDPQRLRGSDRRRLDGPSRDRPRRAPGRGRPHPLPDHARARPGAVPAAVRHDRAAGARRPRTSSPPELGGPLRPAAARRARRRPRHRPHLRPRLARLDRAGPWRPARSASSRTSTRSPPTTATTPTSSSATTGRRSCCSRRARSAAAGRTGLLATGARRATSDRDDAALLYGTSRPARIAMRPWFRDRAAATPGRDAPGRRPVDRAGTGDGSRATSNEQASAWLIRSPVSAVGQTRDPTIPLDTHGRDVRRGVRLARRRHGTAERHAHARVALAGRRQLSVDSSPTSNTAVTGRWSEMAAKRARSSGGGVRTSTHADTGGGVHVVEPLGRRLGGAALPALPVGRPRVGAALGPPRRRGRRRAGSSSAAPAGPTTRPAGPAGRELAVDGPVGALVEVAGDDDGLGARRRRPRARSRSRPPAGRSGRAG